MAAIPRPDDLVSRILEIESALSRLERADRVSNATVRAATLWFTDGTALQLTLGLKPDGTYGIIAVGSISANDLQTASGQRFKIFAQASDPGAADSDPNVTRIWFQTS